MKKKRKAKPVMAWAIFWKDGRIGPRIYTSRQNARQSNHYEVDSGDRIARVRIKEV